MLLTGSPNGVLVLQTLLSPHPLLYPSRPSEEPAFQTTSQSLQAVQSERKAIGQRYLKGVPCPWHSRPSVVGTQPPFPRPPPVTFSRQTKAKWCSVPWMHPEPPRQPAHPSEGTPWVPAEVVQVPEPQQRCCGLRDVSLVTWLSKCPSCTVHGPRAGRGGPSLHTPPTGALLRPRAFPSWPRASTRAVLPAGDCLCPAPLRACPSWARCAPFQGLRGAQQRAGTGEGNLHLPLRK